MKKFVKLIFISLIFIILIFNNSSVFAIEAHEVTDAIYGNGTQFEIVTSSYEYRDTNDDGRVDERLDDEYLFERGEIVKYTGNYKLSNASLGWADYWFNRNSIYGDGKLRWKQKRIYSPFKC